MGDRTPTRLAIVATLLAVAVGVAPPAWATREHPSDGHTVTFTASYNDPGTRISGIDPHHCGPTQTGGCAVTIAGTAFFDAPLRTVDTYHGYGYLDADARGMSAETWDTNTGYLAGCGWGSFVMHQTNAHVTFDPASGSARITLDWTLEDGHGAFEGATGSGTGVGSFVAPADLTSFPGVPNRGQYHGTITCPAGER